MSFNILGFGKVSLNLESCQHIKKVTTLTPRIEEYQKHGLTHGYLLYPSSNPHPIPDHLPLFLFSSFPKSSKVQIKFSNTKAKCQCQWEILGQTTFLEPMHDLHKTANVITELKKRVKLLIHYASLTLTIQSTYSLIALSNMETNPSLVNPNEITFHETECLDG